MKNYAFFAAPSVRFRSRVLKQMAHNQRRYWPFDKNNALALLAIYVPQKRWGERAYYAGQREKKEWHTIPPAHDIIVRNVHCEHRKVIIYFDLCGAVLLLLAARFSRVAIKWFHFSASQWIAYWIGHNDWFVFADESSPPRARAGVCERALHSNTPSYRLHTPHKNCVVISVNTLETQISRHDRFCIKVGKHID